jgi:hypothetical protein
VSYPSQFAAGNRSGPAVSVGYGVTGVGGSGKSSGAPPGWPPSGGAVKSNAPFANANTGPWS